MLESVRAVILTLPLNYLKGTVLLKPSTVTLALATGTLGF